MIVVSDAGPIIHLSLVGRIDLLPSLYGQILIPDLVFKEVAQDGEGLAGSSELRNAEWAQLVSHDPQADLFQILRADLDAGEAAAVWLAVERKASLILSDDRQARLAAGRLGFPVIGTVGILAEAKRKRLVPALAPVLLALKEKGVWLSSLLIQKILPMREKPWSRSTATPLRATVTDHVCNQPQSPLRRSGDSSMNRLTCPKVLSWLSQC